MKLEAYCVSDALSSGDYISAIAALARHFKADELNCLPIISWEASHDCIQEINIRCGNKIYCWAEEVGFWMLTEKRLKTAKRPSGVRIWAHSMPCQK